MKFYRCKTCGKLVTARENENPVCCGGTDFEEIIPNTTEAATEKHIPVLSREGQTVTVTVGSVLHPSLENHYIEWILLETKGGAECRELKPGDEPIAQFYVAEDDEVTAAYASCNLHGIWKS